MLFWSNRGSRGAIGKRTRQESKGYLGQWCKGQDVRKIFKDAIHTGGHMVVGHCTSELASWVLRNLENGHETGRANIETRGRTAIFV